VEEGAAREDDPSVVRYSKILNQSSFKRVMESRIMVQVNRNYPVALNAEISVASLMLSVTETAMFCEIT
jgi:hypothetical protein